MAIKHGMNVTYPEGSSAINLHEVTWQTKDIESRLSQCLLSQKLFCGDILKGVPTIVTILIYYIYTCRNLMNTKLSNVLSYFERLPLLKPYDPMTTGPA